MFYQPYYPQSQQQVFHNNHVPNQFFMPPYHSTYIPNPSNHNLNFTRDFEHYSVPLNGFNSIPIPTYPFYDLTNHQQQRWNQNLTRIQQYNYRTPAFYFQDKSTFYYMCNPIITNNNRISIQLTKVYIGPNGDQQRVFVEQEFSNENQLKKFMKNFRQNFEKTFKNCSTNVQNHNENNKLSNIVVIEEPDEEPKIYQQQVYNENIQLKQSTDIKSPLTDSSKFDDHEQYQHSSSIRSNKCRRNKTKYRRQKFDNNINKKENDKLSSNYTRQYQTPPRFQQRYFNNISSNQQNSHWKFNGYSRSYIPSINENPITPPRFTQYKSQPYPRYRRTKQQYQRNQPITITQNLIFTNNKQYQTRVQRTRSDCQLNFPFYNQNRTQKYLDYRPNIYQRNFIPFISPIFYPQRRLYRNIQIQFRLFNPYHSNLNRY